MSLPLSIGLVASSLVEDSAWLVGPQKGSHARQMVVATMVCCTRGLGGF